MRSPVQRLSAGEMGSEDRMQAAKAARVSRNGMNSLDFPFMPIITPWRGLYCPLGTMRHSKTIGSEGGGLMGLARFFGPNWNYCVSLQIQNVDVLLFKILNIKKIE